MKNGRTRLIIISAVVLILAIVLLIWALRGVPLKDVVKILGALQAWQIAVILLVNSGIIFLFALRWWLILRAQGKAPPYVSLVRYRLAAFSISYFTPGQQFGGEPLQVLFLHNRHQIANSTAMASVALDKAFELFANFAVLSGSIAILLSNELFAKYSLEQALPLSIALLLVPLVYFFALRIGRRPFGLLLRKFKNKLTGAIIEAEKQLAELTGRRPALLLRCFTASVLVWAALFFEFWLMLVFLGLSLNGMQLPGVVVASRIALLAPTPGALGALEASQVLAMQALGFDPAYGLSLSLLIRARDIFFGLLGLLLGGAAGLSAYRRSPR
jgi:hypothetical protein